MLLLDRAMETDRMAQLASKEPEAVKALHTELGIAEPADEPVEDEGGDDNVIVLREYSLTELADRLGVH